MEPKSRKRHIALPAALAVGLLLFLAAGGAYFVRYLRQQIYEERTSQLVEITAQVQVNLNNALDTQWRYLTVAVNVLEEKEVDAVSAATCVAKLEAARAIRAGEHPEAKMVPIIAMTANAFVDDVRAALESGMDAHIAKLGKSIP